MLSRRKRTKLGKDGRRKHHRFEAKIFYKDGVFLPGRIQIEKRLSYLQIGRESLRS